MLKFLASVLKTTPKVIEISDRAGVATSLLIKSLREKFPVEISGCTDEELDKTFPSPPKTTTRLFRECAEADKEFSWLSMGDLIMLGVNRQTMKFRERLEFELVWFEKTGSHPDQKRTATLCTGSPVPPHNNVARVFWKDNKLQIKWCCPNSKDKYLRARKIQKP